MHLKVNVNFFSTHPVAKHKKVLTTSTESPCICLSHPVSIWVTLNLSESPCISQGHTVYLWVTMSLSESLCISLSYPVPLRITRYLTEPPCISLSHPVSLRVTQYLLESSSISLSHPVSFLSHHVSPETPFIPWVTLYHLESCCISLKWVSQWALQSRQCVLNVNRSISNRYRKVSTEQPP